MANPMDPELMPYLPLLKRIEMVFTLPVAEMKAANKGAPLAVTDDTPCAAEFEASHELVATSDGSKMDLQIYKPKKVTGALPLYLVMHGGGWVLGGHGGEEGMTRSVCVKNECVVVSVDYRMAPEHTFPCALNDCYDALKWCVATAAHLGIDRNQIILGGSSAGANLAAALALRARNEGIPGIIGQVLNIPVTCHPKFFPKDRYEYNSFEENKDAPILSAKNMNWFWDQYMPTPSDDPSASPLLAKSFKGLSPALVQVAGLDPLRDEGLAYAKALRAAGVKVTDNFYPGLPHGFAIINTLSKTKLYQQAVVDFIGQLLLQPRNSL